MNTSREMPLVVLATDSSVPSGMGEHMLTLARTLISDYRIVLAFPPIRDGATYLRRAHAAGFAVKPIGAGLSFSRWLRDCGAELLHVHAGIGWEGHGLANAGWSVGTSVIRTEHLPYLLTDETQKTEHRLAVGLVDYLIFVSKAAATSYRDAGFAGSKYVTVQNGIERPRPSTSREATRESLGIAPNDALVITVARFTAQKNYGLLLAAAKVVADKAPRFRILCVGDGPERRAMMEKSLAAGLGDTISFLGTRDDTADLLLASDLFVLPSLFEGLPLSVLEAMALGLGIVATRIGGTCEALGDDYGWLVPSNSAEALAGTIVEALSDKDKRKHFGRRNRNRFDEHFCAGRMGRETAALYRSLLSQKASAA